MSLSVLSLLLLAACTLTYEAFEPEKAVVLHDIAKLDAGPNAPEPGATASDAGEIAACSATSELPRCVVVPSVPELGGADSASAAATCADGAKNQDETALDCGGRCRTCAAGQGCSVGADCESGVCADRGCSPGDARCCQLPACNDGVLNGVEPIADCGDAICGLCPIGSPCRDDGQCASGVCRSGTCEADACSDGSKNGVETDIDCGGSDLSCARCSPGAACASNADCSSGACINSICEACADGARDGSESDVDCGGSCGQCEPGRRCEVDTDCQSGACQDGSCCGGVRADCTRCARRLARTLVSCSSDGAAAEANCNTFLQCLADNSDVCPTRYSPGCTDDPGGVCNHTAFGGNGGPGLVLADRIIGTAACSF